MPVEIESEPSHSEGGVTNILIHKPGGHVKGCLSLMSGVVTRSVPRWCSPDRVYFNGHGDGARHEPCTNRTRPVPSLPERTCLRILGLPVPARILLPSNGNGVYVSLVWELLSNYGRIRPSSGCDTSVATQSVCTSFPYFFVEQRE